MYQIRVFCIINVIDLLKEKSIFLFHFISFAVIYFIDSLVGESVKNLISDRINRKPTKTKILIILTLPNKTIQKGFFIISLQLFSVKMIRKLIEK